MFGSEIDISRSAINWQSSFCSLVLTRIYPYVFEMVIVPPRSERQIDVLILTYILKKQQSKRRFVAMGVRWAESRNREKSRGIYEVISTNKKKRVILTKDDDDTQPLFESRSPKARRTCNPIVDWTDADVWDYLSSEHIPVNPLYSCGFSRVGCIGCPMAGTKGRQFEFAHYPKYRAMYVQAFERMLAERKRRGRPNGWGSAKGVFHWWMEDGVIPSQMSFDDLEWTA